MTRHGVVFETADDGAMREMALCFVEEFSREGMGRERLLELFATKDYAGPHLAYRTLGEAAITEIIDECLLRWGPAGPRTTDLDEKGRTQLPLA